MPGEEPGEAGEGEMVGFGFEPSLGFPFFWAKASGELSRTIKKKTDCKYFIINRKIRNEQVKLLTWIACK